MTETADWPHIIAAMRAGGYYDRIMGAGPELDRVKAYLRAFEDPKPGADPEIDPHYPLFPGLRHKPFHDTAGHAGVARLEAAFADILAEAAVLEEESQLDYTIASRPARSLRNPGTWLARRAPARAWTVYPFFHMGVDVEALTQCCPRSLEVVRGLPGLCVDYPWGDAIFSVQGAHSRLPPHCSVDSLRVRCHLALRIPPEVGIRVGGEARQWQEGKCLLFEDAYRHEVWNNSDVRRIVMIVDFWHPDLTEIEVRALTAGFRKSDVRQIFLRKRITLTNSPEPYVRHMEAALAAQDQEAVVREFWPG